MKWSFLIFSHFITNIKCAEILAIFAFPTYSHYLVGLKLVNELANRGHNVTFVSFYSHKESENKFIDIPLNMGINDTEDKAQMHLRETLSPTEIIKMIVDVNLHFAKIVFDNENFQELLQSKRTFDLIIYENFVIQIYSALGYYYNCPVISFSNGPSSVFNNLLFRNPHYSSYIPNLGSRFSTNMNFLDRVKNLYYDLLSIWYLHSYSIPEQNKILQKYIGPIPDIKFLMYNMSLSLLNTHASIGIPSPKLPNIKEVGGFHLKHTNHIPKQIEEYLNNSENGVFVFSMGSILQSKYIDNDRLQIIINSFSNIKQNVLWKFEDDAVKMPKNVKCVKWLPQEDVLAHSNVKAFISHCGLLSVIEAVYHGVPLICIPVFSDQFTNSKIAAERGYGIDIPYIIITKNKFSKALKEIISNSNYMINAKEMSIIIRDQPMKPMDAAIFCIEHVIKYKGAFYLQPIERVNYWWQENSLNMICIVSSLFLIALSYFLVYRKI